jgi:hypothetical protein
MTPAKNHALVVDVREMLGEMLCLRLQRLTTISKICKCTATTDSLIYTGEPR